MWDYYYSQNDNNSVLAGDDKNGEDYKIYYQGLRTTPNVYANYPLQQPGHSYLIGFPGHSYYEFDLSGEWTPSNTASPAPAKLPQQILTFASKASGTGSNAVTIGVSDDEMTTAALNGFTHVPNYKNVELAAEEGYVLSSDGDSFVKNTADATVNAFRTYITGSVSGTRGGTPKDVERIIFSSSNSNLLPSVIHPQKTAGSLNAYAGKDKIVVESTLDYTVDVSLYTPSGLLVTTFPVKSGETVEQPVYSNGVYIVRSLDVQYVKKLIVK